MEEIARAMKVAGLEAEDEVADCHARKGVEAIFVLSVSRPSR